MSIGLVTGGASGIGKAIAERLAADGCTVVFTDIDAKAGQATASACGLAFIRQDVADESSWSAVLDEVESRYGPLTILVNNAGTLGGVVESFDPEHISLETWRRTFRVNVEGTFLGCRAGIRVMRASGVRPSRGYAARARENDAPAASSLRARSATRASASSADVRVKRASYSCGA